MLLWMSLICCFCASVRFSFSANARRTHRRAVRAVLAAATRRREGERARERQYCCCCEPLASFVMGLLSLLPIDA